MALKTISPGCGVWSSLMLFFVFHTEIQHGCQKWQEMVFGKKGQMTAYLAGQTSGTVSKISAFLDFMQKLKEAIQKWKKMAGDSRYTLQTTIRSKLFYFIPFPNSKINALLISCRNSRSPPKTSADTLQE